MEFVVNEVAALNSQFRVTERSSGKVFPLITLEMQVMTPDSSKQEVLRLHLSPPLLEALLPKLKELTREALLLATKPGEPGPRH